MSDKGASIASESTLAENIREPDSGDGSTSHTDALSSSSVAAEEGALDAVSGVLGQVPEKTQEETVVEATGRETIKSLSLQQSTQIKNLQKESMRIEDSIVIAQRVVHFQRNESQIAMGEATEAKLLLEREGLERQQLAQTNEGIATERKSRKAVKTYLMRLVNTLKDKQTECKHLREAHEVASYLRVLLQQKRRALQLTARQNEDREKQARLQLQESHERSSKNLLVWQELELRNLSNENVESMRQVNKLKGQQLREIQQKEAEQLRELQHLKAKLHLGNFDAEMEFTERFERQKAEQLVASQALDRRHKAEKQAEKRKITSLKEQARVTHDTEMQMLKSDQLIQNQIKRAKDLMSTQKDRSKEREKAFEFEMEARADEFKEMLASTDFKLSASGHSGSDRSGSRSQSQYSRSSHSEGRGRTSTEEEQAQDTLNKENQKIKTLEDEDAARRTERHKAMNAEALAAAETSMVQQKEEHRVEVKKLVTSHSDMNQNLMAENEEKKAQVRQMNEQTTMELMKAHTREKSEMQAAHDRELRALQKAIQLEKQLHSKTLSETQVASQAKSEFLSFVCHELRNPLSGIVAIVDMLLAGNLTDDLQANMKTVKHESELMCAIVNDVLDFAKIEANMLVLDPVPMDLHQTVREMMSEQKLIALKSRPDLAIECIIHPQVPSRIITDPIRLRQVLLNIISNAIKFTFEGKVSLILTLKGISNGKALIEFMVQDTGVGISQKDQKHIFSAFSQANPSTTREFGGTGLGLSISKALVERLGGKISLESEKGVGTKFFFTINSQIAENKDTKVVEEKPEATIPVGLNVLVVEDSNTLRRLWAKLLKEQKCNVDTAANGMDGIEMCKKKAYEVVLMDITMPVMSGDEAVKKLRDMKWEGVVIALTANAMESDREKYLSAGMDAVVTKPFQMNHLRTVIYEQLKKRGKFVKS